MRINNHPRSKSTLLSLWWSQRQRQHHFRPLTPSCFSIPHGGFLASGQTQSLTKNDKRSLLLTYLNKSNKTTGNGRIGSSSFFSSCVIFLFVAPKRALPKGPSSYHPEEDLHYLGKEILSFFEDLEELLAIVLCSMGVSVGLSVAALNLVTSLTHKISIFRFIPNLLAMQFKHDPNRMDQLLYLSSFSYILAAAAFLVFSRLLVNFRVIAVLFFIIFIVLACVGVYLLGIVCCFNRRIAFTVKLVQTAASILVMIPSATILSYFTLVVQALWVTLWMCTLSHAIEAPLYVLGFLLFR